MVVKRPFAKGNTADLYRCEHHVVKVFKEYLPKTEALYEAQKQRLAYSTGLRVPRVADVIEVEGRQAIVMEYIQGKPIGPLLQKNEQQDEFYIRVCVDVHVEIHQIQPEFDALEPMTGKLRRQLNASDLERNIVDLLLNRLSTFQFEPRLCHGDFHPNNVLIDQEDVTIIDWVDASVGDRRADVARTYILIAQSSLPLAKQYLTIYCEQAGVIEEEIYQWIPIIAAARLTEHLESEDSGILKEILYKHLKYLS
ncbi:phosphotransferase family protein [Geomicrobium sp. JCM 19039]|uniref:phosphotransferase family protein n=1 Tax=Geomicrobium sp. JCM 19039 TaxID=1460636 RepID=UPI00045F4B78|nr:aminoglycoside phosphotransferase family protein [Geomicrobium sp. JCM 19039]GAK14363.1 probable aminoglycoside phosphotransferase [Geomicrobium sp. JCM 19039]